MKAKVFLSCGQSKDTDEPELAKEIANRIRELGFDCYVAIAEQSLTGLRENIFRQMESSEYFVFVDFKREKISASGDADAICRGSLFSHQELGVASYLEMPCLVFQEKGVMERDGMLSCIQGNAHSFADRAQLPNVIADMIRKKTDNGKWSSTWKNALSLHMPRKPFVDAHNSKYNITYRNFHLEVRNNHRRKVALNCYAILEAITNAANGEAIPVQTVEFKWAGTILPSVFIAANSSRRFDALKVALDVPSKILFNTYCDSSEFYPSVPGFGTYHLTYGVYSSNFSSAHRTFKLSHPGNLENLHLVEA
jgi:hypothetical protein